MLAETSDEKIIEYPRSVLTKLTEPLELVHARHLGLFT